MSPHKHAKKLSLTFFVGLGLLLTSCSLKKPAEVTPPPNIQNISKSFFLNSGNPSAAGFQLNGATPKTFACGWAPESENGNAAWAYTHNYNYASHCNIKFKIFEKNLVGYLVNPSQSEDKWEPVITIGIKKHYYYEKRRDENGRETNEYVEETRSDWEARPYISLDLSTVSVQKWAYSMFWTGGGIVTGVPEDQVEWDLENNFLGFTVEAHDAYLGSDSAGKFRFTSLAFDHDSSFEKTPFVPTNSQHFNVLHILGTRHSGLSQDGVEMYGAKWDVRKTHTIYLNQFPPEYVDIGKDIVKHWNDTFEKIFKDTGKTVRPFVVKAENLKHAFDLRKPAITWVEDKRMASYGPLGVGMVTADVRNGKILWGGVTIWGGMIRSLVNHYVPTISSASQSVLQHGVQLGLVNHREKTSNMPQGMREFVSGIYNPSSNLNLKMEIEQKLKENNIKDLDADQAKNLRYVLDASVASGIDEVLRKMESFQAMLRESLVDTSSEKLFDSDYIQSLAGGSESFEKSLERLESSPFAHFMGMNPTGKKSSNLKNLSVDEITKKIESGINKQQSSNAAFDFDRSFDQVALGWNMAVQSGKASIPEVRRSVVKDLLLHEWGHVLGLGHNFKENIIPAEGTVPEHFIKDLQSFNNEEKGYIQMTTVMGYRSGFTEAVAPYDHIKPGPMDELVLTYLYRKKYATFTFGDEKATDFQLKDLPPSGEIPPYIPVEQRVKGQTYASYFPACNDYYASIGSDPYCRRWDRGGDAVSLVENKFKELRGSLTSLSYSFSDSVNGGDYRWREYYLFNRALKTFGDARVFYDYMRQKYDASVIRPQISSGVDGEKNMLDFSKACRGAYDHPNYVNSQNDASGAAEQEEYNSGLRSAVSNKTLKKVFAENPELKELCVATGILMHEIRNALKTSGKDYAVVDYNNYHQTASMLGGDTFQGDFNGQDIGKWLEIGKWPLKTAAIQALTLPYAYSVWNGWAIPMRKYSRQDGQYLLSTLYPVEFNLAVKSGVIDNLELSQDPGSSSENNILGNTVRTLGWSMFWQYYGNDVKRFPGLAKYFEMIRRQTQFRLNLSAIVVKKTPEKGNEDRTKQLDGDIYNPNTGNFEPLDAVYLTEDYKIVGPPPEKSLLYPMTPLKVYSADSGYYLAYKMDYDKQYDDVLFTSSIKAELYNTYKRVLETCISGEKGRKNGLAEYFNSANEDFQGFDWRDNVYKDDKALTLHLSSISKEFNNYYRNVPGARPETCTEAIRGMGLIVNAAAILNGFYLDAYDYIEHARSW